MMTEDKFPRLDQARGDQGCRSVFQATGHGTELSGPGNDERSRLMSRPRFRWLVDLTQAMVRATKATTATRRAKKASEEIMTWSPGHDAFLEARLSEARTEQASGIEEVRGLLMTREPKNLKIHRPPGFKLLYLAEFLFSRKSFTEVLEPTLRDLQEEHNEALANGRIGKARWVKHRGYFSFWSAVVALAPVSLVKRLTEIWKVLP